MGKQPLCCCLQVRYLKGKTNLPAELFSRFDLVDRLCLRFIKYLQRGAALIEDQRSTLTIIPKLGRLDSESECYKIRLSVRIPWWSKWN